MVHSSDRNRKEGFEAVDVEAVLEGVAHLPILRWQYKPMGHRQDQGVRHLGPMAQDFHSAFGLGQDEVTIATVDADGVALAAIQGLYLLVREQDQKLQASEQQIEALRNRVAELETLEMEVEQLKRLVQERLDQQ